MSIRRAVPALLSIAVLGLAACGDDDTDTTSGSGEGAATPPAEAEQRPAGSQGDALSASGDAVRSAKVEIVDFEYAPATVTIEEGGKVTWMNEDSEQHTATLDDGSFDSGPLAEGKLKSESFKEPGTYPYHCDLHPEMTGTVEVVPG